jgi:hypothetical protein
MDNKEWMRVFQQTADSWKEHRKVSQTCRWISHSIPCYSPTVGSHTIQRMGGLVRVASNGKVVTWGLAGPKGLQYATKNIANASVFPGYCEDHEKVFAEAENRKYLQNRKEYVEQLLRSIDLATYELEAGRDTFGRLVSELVERAASGEAGLDLSTAIRHEEQYKDKEYALKVLQGMRTSTQKHYDAGSYESIPLFTKVFSEPTPVCLTGLETVKTPFLGRMPLICCVFPELGGTRVIFATRDTFQHYLKEHLVLWRAKTWKDSVRWWMTYATDNWYLNPDIFNKWTDDDRHEFLREAELQGGASFFRKSPVKLWDEDFIETE